MLNQYGLAKSYLYISIINHPGLFAPISVSLLQLKLYRPFSYSALCFGYTWPDFEPGPNGIKTVLSRIAPVPPVTTRIETRVLQCG